MARIIVLLICLLGLGCSAAPARTVDLEIRNRTTQPITIQADAGFLSRSLTLQPGESWVGYIPLQWLPKKVSIDVSPVRHGEGKNPSDPRD